METICGNGKKVPGNGFQHHFPDKEPAGRRLWVCLGLSNCWPTPLSVLLIMWVVKIFFHTYKSFEFTVFHNFPGNFVLVCIVFLSMFDVQVFSSLDGYVFQRNPKSSPQDLDSLQGAICSSNLLSQSHILSMVWTIFYRQVLRTWFECDDTRK